MKNKAFTLIELLAVIIILGILMLIAIPSVTNYINNSRKNTYVTTVNELIKGAIAKVNSGELNMLDEDTTYYIPSSCIKLENGEAKSPYGKFDPAYVVVNYDGENYQYFFTGKDVQNMGVPTPVSTNDLSKDNIVSNVDAIDTSIGIENTQFVSIFNEDCTEINETKAVSQVIDSSSVIQPPKPYDCSKDKVCKRAKTLHTIKCDPSLQCYSQLGFYAEGSQGTDTATFGSLGTKGTLVAGDAYDCDVNCDGIYDPDEERFYYVSSYYDGYTNTFDNTRAVLIFSHSIKEGQIIDEKEMSKDYDKLGFNGWWNKYYISHHVQDYYVGNHNWYPPDRVYQDIPDTSSWSNPKLITGLTRQLRDDEGRTEYSDHQLGEFTYENKAGRLLTYQEIMKAFEDNGMTSWGISNVEKLGILKKSIYFMENTNVFINNASRGYWLETPQSRYDVYWWMPWGVNLFAYHGPSTLRPVIDVLKTNMEI